MKSTSAIALAASFATLALASPYHMQQHAARDNDVVVDWVTEIAVVTAWADVTEYFTGWAAAETTSISTSTSIADVTSTTSVEEKGHHWTWSPTFAVVSSSSAVPTTSSSSSSSSSTPLPSTTSIVVVTTPSTTSTTSIVATPTSSKTSTIVTTSAPVTTAAVAGAYGVNTGAGPYLVPQMASSEATNTWATPATTLTAYVGTETGDASYESSNGNLQAQLLNSTNVWRALFQAEPLTWNATLEAQALDTAQLCLFDHTNAGQNLAAGYSSPTAANEGWSLEYIGYDFDPPNWDEDAGHFTQVVWQGTTTIGCAAVNCGSNMPAQGWYLVCNYLPVGNMLGEFPENVLTMI